MLSKSNVTSLSFTVSDDLLSNESSLNSTQKTAFHGLKPFSKQYGIDNKPFDQRPLPNRQNREIIQRAQMDAYKQMNENLYNPFEHKLGNAFIPKESDLYIQQKQRQIELIKKKEAEIWNNKNNYTIVFHNEKKSKHNLQMAGKNIVAEADVPSIGDYYKMKFGNKQMQHIEQEDEDYGQDSNAQKKVNNFVASSKKSQKSVGIEPVTNQKPKSVTNIKKEPAVTKKQTKEPTSIKNIPNNKMSNKKENESRKSIDLNESKRNIDPVHDNKKSEPQQKSNKKEPNIMVKKQIIQSQSKPFTNNIPTSNKNIEYQKKQELKKQIPPKKPQVPKSNNNNPKQGTSKKKYSQVYNGPDRNLVQQLERQLTQCPTISFDDIAQLQTAKNLLQQAVLLPRLMPQFFQGIRKAIKGILLFGPPGTGKTLLAKAVAKDNIFFNVSASSLASKWKGQSQKMVRILFQMAKYHSPSVIFFDEIDAIGSKRSQNEHESARKVKTELLVQMDGVGSSQSEVFVLAATNRPWDLDQALRRRLQKRIYIPLPGAEGRKKMFDINLKGLKISSKMNWEKLVELTKGCSGADICNVCRDAAYMPMRRKINQIGGIAKLQQLKQTQLIDEQILESDLLEAAKKVKPSVGKDDLKRYQSWMAQFGSI